MAGLEDALAAIEAKIIDAQKAADRLTKLLRKLGQAASVGNIRILEEKRALFADVVENVNAENLRRLDIDTLLAALHAGR
jgi:hypothetical protein